MVIRGKSSAIRGTEVAADTVWRVATVREVTPQSSTVVALRLEVPDRQNHIPGQHYVVRLTAENGYTASRSYSIASSPSDPFVELAVEMLVDGEVSGYLTREARPGDQLEVRGPIGGWFVWDASSPAVGIAGGTGVVPLVSMLRYARELGRTDLLRLAVSTRSRRDLAYADELAGAGALIAVTGHQDANLRRPAGRLTAAELAPVLTGGATCFICGSAAFAEAATQLLLTLDVAAADIKVERFGFSA